MKNTINDLNDILFETLGRMTDDSLSPEELDKEIKRSEAVQKVAKTIIENGALALSAKKHLDEYGEGKEISIGLLGVNNEVPPVNKKRIMA